MKNFKITLRFVVLMLLVLVIGVSTLAGCGSNTNQPTTTTQAGTTQQATTAAPKEETLKVTWFHIRDIPSGEKSEVVKALEEKFNFEFTLLSSPPADANTYLNTLMASQELPDVLDNYFSDFGIQKQIYTELTTDQIQKYMPNHWKKLDELSPMTMEKLFDVIKNDDGKIRRVPSYALYDLPLALLWNKTYLDELGLAVPTTFDEVEAVFKAFKTKYPDKFPYDALSKSGDYAFDFTLVMFAGGFNPRQWSLYGDQIKWNATAPENTAVMKELFGVLARWYKAGYINPDFVNNDYGKMQTNFFNGMSIVHDWGAFPGALDKTNPNSIYGKMLAVNPKFELVPGPRMGIKPGVQNKFLYFGPLLYDQGFGVNIRHQGNEDNIRRLLNFVDQVSYDEDTFALAYMGIKGKHWDMVDGTPKRLPGFDTSEKYGALGIGEYFPHLAYAGPASGPMDKYTKTPEDFKLKNEYWGAGKMYPNNYPDDFSIDALIKGNLINDKGEDVIQKYVDDEPIWATYFVDIIIGKKPVDAYDEYVKKWYEVGGQEKIDVATKLNIGYWK